MKYYCSEVDDVLTETRSARDGLSVAEAATRLEENGKNKLAEGKKDSLVKRFFAQMADPMIIMLIVAAVISAVTSRYSGEGFADVIIIMFVVIVNAALGVYQENKAEKALEALQEMSSATSKVLRGGQQITIKSEDLVVGDVIILEAGDAVPADGRIIDSKSMKIEEAALTRPRRVSRRSSRTRRWATAPRWRSAARWSRPGRARASSSRLAARRSWGASPR